MKRALGKIMLFAGILAVLSSAVLSAYAYLGESRTRNNTARAAREISEIIQSERVRVDRDSDIGEDAGGYEEEDFIEEAHEEVRADPPVRTPRPIDISDGSYIGILRIPALSLELPIGSEFSEAALDKAPCVYYGDLSGVLVIGAHNTRSHFRSLPSLVHGNEVIITDTGGNEHRYIVSAIEVLCETDISARIGGPFDLTLFTCTVSRTERIVVRCLRADVVEPVAATDESYAVLAGTTLVCSRGRVVLDSKYEVYDPVRGRWGRIPKVDGDAEFEIRLRSTLRVRRGVTTGHEASEPGRLIITWGVYRTDSRGRTRSGITAAEIVAPLRAVPEAEDIPYDIVFIRGEHSYYRSDTYILAEGVNYTANALLHRQARLIAENIITLEPNGQIRPIVVGPSAMHGHGLTLQEAAGAAYEQGYVVLGGINAGHFYMSNRTPIGLQIREGVLTSLNFFTQPAAGFFADGSVIFGEPDVIITVSGDGGTFTADRLNKVRIPGHICLYTPDFSENTRVSQDGVQIVLEVGGNLSLGSTITGTVTGVLHGSTPHVIAAGEMVLAASTQAEIDRMAFLSEGSTVTLTVSCSDERWNGVSSAVGGLNYLVRDGQDQHFSDNIRAPRTAIGISGDGTVIFYTVDGRQPGHSAGLTLGELAARMAEMGSVTAFTLDGGGSTTMFARIPDGDTAVLVNRPSDGPMRRCADFILLVYNDLMGGS
jgi:sortase (surface protein transpeptidase)